MAWISVKERLPDTDSDVLIYVTGQFPFQCSAYYHPEKGWGSMDWYVTSDRCLPDWRERITHWMPLPEPPGFPLESRDGCTCNKGLRKNKIDVLISDELWDRINPENDVATATLSKFQLSILAELRVGAVIGETTIDPQGRYELFVRRNAWRPLTNHPRENPFLLRHIPRGTVFSLLALGLVVEDEKIAESMLPFVRDTWYGCCDKDS